MVWICDRNKSAQERKAMLSANIISYPLLLILLGYFPAGQE